MAESSTNTTSPPVEDESDYDWESYKKKFGKQYSAAEDLKRREIFNEKIKEIKRINSLYAEGKCSYTAGVNQFTDQGSDEMGMMCGVRK